MTRVRASILREEELYGEGEEERIQDEAIGEEEDDGGDEEEVVSAEDDFKQSIQMSEAAERMSLKEIEGDEERLVPDDCSVGVERRRRKRMQQKKAAAPCWPDFVSQEHDVDQVAWLDAGGGREERVVRGVTTEPTAAEERAVLQARKEQRRRRRHVASKDKKGATEQELGREVCAPVRVVHVLRIASTCLMNTVSLSPAEQGKQSSVLSGLPPGILFQK